MITTLVVKKSNNIHIIVSVLFSLVMYVFIPEHFLVKNFNNNSVRIHAQTSVCRGVRFLTTQGRWILSEAYFDHSETNHIHWFYLLYTYSRQKNTDYDDTNALVFREKGKIIIEITHQIENNTIINASFHHISLKEIALLTEVNEGQQTNIGKPLDLSLGTLRNLSADVSITRVEHRRRQMLPCNLCGKEFDRPSLLKRHIRTHTGERPHVCDACGKGFSTSSSLNTHKRIHSGERPHQCGMCGKRFTASSNLYYHRLTHSKEKPHKCDVCGKSFPTPGNLRSHEYSHGGSSPYKCTICSRVFTKPTNLKNHISLYKH